jgi:hypothetical protein
MSEISRKSVIAATSVVGLLRRRRLTLTSAQILALFTTPQTLLPAAGVGMYQEIDSITAMMKFGTIAYTGANAVEIRYFNAAGAKSTGDLAAAWLNNASTRVDKTIGVAVTEVVNAPIVVCVPTANPGAGDGTVTFDIKYRTVSLS